MKTELNSKKYTAAVLLAAFTSLVTAGGTTAPELDDQQISFRDIPALEQPYIDPSPAAKKDLIQVGKLGQDGGDKKAIIKLAKEVAANQHGKFDSLLIYHQDRLLFESYYLRGRINGPHPQASATKSYTSMAIGRAIQLGYLSMADLEKPVVSFLKELDPSKLVAGVEKITLHQAMTMRSGVRLSEAQMDTFDEKPEQLKGQGQVQTYLQHSEPITDHSQSFKYQGVDPNLVMQVLDAVVPGTAKDFIKTELLDKLGMSEYAWREGVSGLPTAGFGASMTSRNMLKWGMLTKNQGRWNGEQLIPAAFIKKATHRIVHLGEDDIFFTGDLVTKPGYGYYWWQADMQVGNKTYFTTSAQGGGSQYIILIDELDLIVVVTAHDRDAQVMQITAERILPAF